MTPPPATTDRLASVTAGSLAVLALGATGWLELPLLPRTPVEALCAATPWIGLLLLGALASERASRGPALRVLGLAFAAAPFLAFAVHGASGGSIGLVLPGVGLLALVALVLCFSAAPVPWRRGAAGVALALFVGDAALAAADAPLLPAAWNPARAPIHAALAVAREDGAPPAERRGERPGCFVRGAGDLPERDAAGAPIGEAWGVATSGPLARDVRALRLLDPRLASGTNAAPGTFRPDGRFELAVVADGPRPDHAFDLSAYDALLLGPDAWDDDGAAAQRAAAVDGWVRDGGLLFVGGDAEGRAWPPSLERALGQVARASAESVGRPARQGEGRVVVAADVTALAQLFASFADLLEARPLGSAFDGLAVPPPAPASFTPPDDAPRRRRGQGALLLGFAVAVVLLEPGARTWRGALALLALPCAAGVFALLGAAPASPDVAAHAAALEWGGAGGRRVEVVRLVAGERGYVGAVAFRGEGATRWAGPPRARDGRVVLRPGEAGWAIRHGVARGPAEGEREDRGAAWLLGWLRGAVDPARLVLLRGPSPEIRVPGAALAETAVLRVRAE
jgi:hypothetical protein